MINDIPLIISVFSVRVVSYGSSSDERERKSERKARGVRGWCLRASPNLVPRVFSLLPSQAKDPGNEVERRPFCAGAQFSRESIRALNDRVKIRENKGIHKPTCYKQLIHVIYFLRLKINRIS